MNEIIVFADYGLDDAAATTTLFRYAQKFSRFTIIPIGGNVPPEIALKNCYTLLSFYPDILNKITVVNTTAVPQPFEFLSEIHGKDGMGDLFRAPETKPNVNTLLFDEWIETTTGSEIVLSLGPMTLVSSLMKKHKTYIPIIMGGCIHSKPNFNGYEFNQCLDREAFAFCTKQKHIAITLDTCHTHDLNIRDDVIKGDDIHAKILRADQYLSIIRGEDGCYVWDDIAATYLIHPERFTIAKEPDRDGNTIFNATYISNKHYYDD